MEASILIRKALMSCPLCEKTHEVEERKRMNSNLPKRQTMDYTLSKMPAEGQRSHDCSVQ